MDACEKLSQLKLTEVQQREIIRVILHCCGNVRRASSSVESHVDYSLGKAVQSLLCSRWPAALPPFTLASHHPSVLSLGLPP